MLSLYFTENSDQNKLETFNILLGDEYFYSKPGFAHSPASIRAKTMQSTIILRLITIHDRFSGFNVIHNFSCMSKT